MESRGDPGELNSGQWLAVHRPGVVHHVLARVGGCVVDECHEVPVVLILGTGSRGEHGLGTAPALTLEQASGQADPAKAGPITFTLSANEALDAATVTASDFTATGGTLGTISCSGASCTIPVTPSAQGTVSIAPSGTFSVTDTAGNATTTAGGTDRTVTYDTVVPTATVTAPASPTNATSPTFTVTFSETVSGLAAGDFTTSGTATGCVIGTPSAASGTSMTVSVSGCSEGTLGLTLAANGVTDTAGNTGPAANASSSTITIDRTAPTASFTASPATPNKATSLAYTLTFSKAVSGLSASDFQVSGTSTGCTITPSASSGTTFTITLTTCSEGTATLALKASTVIIDAAGNTGPTSAVSASTINFCFASSRMVRRPVRFFGFAGCCSVMFLV